MNVNQQTLLRKKTRRFLRRFPRRCCSSNKDYSRNVSVDLALGYQRRESKASRIQVESTNKSRISSGILEIWAEWKLIRILQWHRFSFDRVISILFFIFLEANGGVGSGIRGWGGQQRAVTRQNKICMLLEWFICLKTSFFILQNWIPYVPGSYNGYLFSFFHAFNRRTEPHAAWIWVISTLFQISMRIAIKADLRENAPSSSRPAHFDTSGTIDKITCQISLVFIIRLKKMKNKRSVRIVCKRDS